MSDYHKELSEFILNNTSESTPRFLQSPMSMEGVAVVVLSAHPTSNCRTLRGLMAPGR